MQTVAIITKSERCEHSEHFHCDSCNVAVMSERGHLARIKYRTYKGLQKERLL
jgi:hypothetical protein